MDEKNEKRKIIKPDRPGGFLDFSGEEYLAREKMLRTIEKVFKSFGYNPIETPIIEFTRILTGEDETSKNIFKVESSSDKGSEPLALRFDQTVPLARFLSANPYDPRTKTGIKLPWRRMVVGPVFRGETPQKGRYRQFYQFDVDIAGSSSMLADAEIVAVIYETLKALGIERFVIRINNRKILNGLSKLVGVQDRKSISADDITKEMMRVLDKIDKIGIDEVELELKRNPENEYDPAVALKAEAVEKVKSYLSISGDNFSKIQQCKKVFSGIEIAEEGILELEQILGFSKAMGVPDNVVEIDFSVARGLDYYTGPVMEASLLDASEFGSIFSGGRYNDLVSRFTGNELPATGASIGVDRLFAALRHLELIEIDGLTVSDIMILRLSNDHDGDYLEISKELRGLNLNVEICLLEDTTFRSQFSFALSRNVKYVVICGEDEFSKNVVQIKNLITREQVEVKRNEVINYFEKS